MPNQNRLIDLRKVCEITCQGKTSIYQLITAGELRRNKPHQPVCARKGQSHE